MSDLQHIDSYPISPHFQSLQTSLCGCRFKDGLSNLMQRCPLATLYDRLAKIDSELDTTLEILWEIEKIEKPRGCE